MPDHELSSTAIILLGSVLGCLLLLLVLVIGISRKVSRIAIQLSTLDALQASAPQENSPGSQQPTLFDDFLAEDPSRSKLTKNEQFAAYRKWRQEKGLNWSAS
jgi:hypothetical protein